MNEVRDTKKENKKVISNYINEVRFFNRNHNQSAQNY